MGDSVGHTASSLSTGILGGIVKKDGRFRPKSVDLMGDCRVINSRAPITLDAQEDKNKGGFPLVVATSVAAVALAEDDKPGEAGAGLHPGLPGTSFRPWEDDDGRSVCYTDVNPFLELSIKLHSP